MTSSPNVRIWAISLCALGMAVTHGTSSGADDSSDSYVRRGFAIAPVPLDLSGKNPALVGLGSYIVNTTGCNDCHTWGPTGNWAPGGNPFIGQPAQINTPYYLSGGRVFSPPGVVSLNLTPDANGLPAGLTLPEFISVFRTGRDPDSPAHILQVMPWPLLGLKTDHDLRAMYEYLRAIPPLPDNY